MRLSLIFILLLLPTLALAAPPNAGQILREQEQNQQQQPSSANIEYKSQQSISPGQNQGPRIMVNGFRFVGDDQVLNTKKLSHLVRRYIGHQESFAQLQEAADVVSQYLRREGYSFARAYLTAQQVNDGIIQVTVLLGRVEKDGIIVNGQNLRINHNRIEQILSQAVNNHDGSYLRMQNLQRGLLLLNNLPGISARANLQAGANPDTTQILANVVEGPLVTGNVSTDNFGDRYTGTERFNSEVDINDAMHHGDQISLQTTGAEHLGIEKVGYSIPVGYNGMRLNTNYSDLRYSIGKEFASLDAHGLAETADVNASYPFILTEMMSLYGSFSYDYKALRDFAQDETTDNKRDNVETMSVYGSSRDAVCGGGLNSYTLALAFGDLNLSGNPANLSLDAASSKTAGDYTKFTYNVTRLQRIVGNWSFFAALNGQVADKNLDSSEKFILGGPTAVRAYPMGEASGDEGWVTNLEVRYDLPWVTRLGNWQMVGFYDAGHIDLYKNAWSAWNSSNSSLPNHYALSGAGFGINLIKTTNYALRLSYAWGFGKNPGANAQGNNSDGKHRNRQLWLQFIIYF